MKAKAKSTATTNVTPQGARTYPKGHSCNEAVSFFTSNSARNGWISTQKNCILQASIFLFERNAHAN